jgi:hypothetical protein
VAVVLATGVGLPVGRVLVVLAAAGAVPVVVSELVAGLGAVGVATEELLEAGAVGRPVGSFEGLEVVGC